MQQTKYDYDALKKEYFDSEIDEIKWFWAEKGLKYNSQVAKRTKGRGQEKKAHKEKLFEEYKEKQRKEMLKKYEVPVEQLLESKLATIGLLRKKLKFFIDMKPEELWNMNMKELEKIRRMLKTELGEPTTIAKNEWKTEIQSSWPLVNIICSDDVEKDEN